MFEGNVFCISFSRSTKRGIVHFVKMLTRRSTTKNEEKSRIRMHDKLDEKMREVQICTSLLVKRLDTCFGYRHSHIQL